MRRSIRRSAYALGAVAAFAVLLALLVLWVGNTDGGRRLIERSTLSLTGGQVQLSGLSGAFPAEIRLAALRLRDARGVWLSAERLSLRWRPLSVLKGRIDIDRLDVGRLDIERAPVADANSPPPRIPHIEIADLTVDTLQLSAALAGARTSLALRGNIDLRSLERLHANLLARRRGAQGIYALNAAFAPERTDAVLTIQEPAAGPLQNLLRLPLLGALQLQASLHGGVGAKRLDLTFTAGALHGRAAGSVDPGGRSADLGFSLASPAMSPRADLAWRRLDAQGRWRGPFDAPTASANLRIDELRVPGGFALRALNAEFSASGGGLRLRSVAEGLEIPGPQPQLLRADPLRIDASMRLNDPARMVQLSAAHALFALRASGTWQSWDVDLRVPVIAPFAAMLGQGAGFHGLENRTSLQISGSIDARAISIAHLRLLGPSLDLTASGGATRAAAGAARLEGLHARWHLELADLREFSPALAGRLDAAGTLSGEPGAIAIESKARATLAVRGSPSGAVSADLQARGLPAAPAGTLRLSGDLDAAPVRVELALSRSGPRFARLRVQRGDWKSAHLTGDVLLGAGLADASGGIALKFGALSDLNGLLGTALKGRLDGDLSIRPARGRAQAALQLRLRDFAAGPIGGDADLSGAGPIDAVALALEARLPALRGSPAAVSAGGSLYLSARRLQLERLAAQYRGETLSLQAPAAIDFADGISLGRLRFANRETFVSLEGRAAPELDLRASVQRLDAALIRVALPGLPMTGRIDAHAQLNGRWSAPTGSLRLEGIGLRAADSAAEGLPALTLHADARLAGDSAAVDATLGAGPASALTISGAVPLNARGAFDLKIAGKLDVALINPLLEAGGRRAAGALRIGAEVAGTADAPRIGGTIGLTAGSLRDYGRGLNLTGIAAQLSGADDLLQIKSFSATASTGTLSMTGSIGILRPGLPLDLHLKASNAEPVVTKIVRANLDADLHLTGKAHERLDLAGDIRLNHATIGIPSALPPDVAVLDVRRRGRPAAAPAAAKLAIGLDVSLQAPRQVLVKGRGLDAELGGSLHFGGTAAAPIVSGGLDLQRGGFTLAGSELNFTSGRVSFDGAGLKNTIDPTLDFTAESALSDATATLRITGYADAPRFEFSSSPPLPQDEILARLLFGENTAQLSALQVAQIGAALATLSGLGADSDKNPLVMIQKTLGLDRLSIGSVSNSASAAGAKGAASIEAGRYVARRVYVEAKQTTVGTSQLQVDVELSKRLKLQTRLGNGTASVQGATPENDPGSSIGLSYQFEY